LKLTKSTVKVGESGGKFRVTRKCRHEGRRRRSRKGRRSIRETNPGIPVHQTGKRGLGPKTASVKSRWKKLEKKGRVSNLGVRGKKSGPVNLTYDKRKRSINWFWNGASSKKTTREKIGDHRKQRSRFHRGAIRLMGGVERSGEFCEKKSDPELIIEKGWRKKGSSVPSRKVRKRKALGDNQNHEKIRFRGVN